MRPAVSVARRPNQPSEPEAGAPRATRASETLPIWPLALEHATAPGAPRMPPASLRDAPATSPCCAACCRRRWWKRASAAAAAWERSPARTRARAARRWRRSSPAPRGPAQSRSSPARACRARGAQARSSGSRGHAASSRTSLGRARCERRSAAVAACCSAPATSGRFLHVRRDRTRSGILYVVAGPGSSRSRATTYWGRRLARWRKGTRAQASCRPRGAFPLLRALLERGELGQLLLRHARPREHAFLGKPVMLADGTARLAFETDALVLPLRVAPRGTRTSGSRSPSRSTRATSTTARSCTRRSPRVHERSILDARRRWRTRRVRAGAGGAAARAAGPRSPPAQPS